MLVQARPKPSPTSAEKSASVRTMLLSILTILVVVGLPEAVSAQDPPGQAYTLEDLLEIGRERNPSLLALRAQEDAMRADRRDSGRWDNPGLEYESGNGDPRDGGGTRSVSGFAVRQTIENPLTRHYRLNALRSREEAAGEEVRVGLADVNYEIRMHFFRILYLQELVELGRLNEEALGAIRELIETRAELGEVRELEAIRLRVEHLRARNEVEAAEIELDQFRTHLNTFLGKALPSDFTLEGRLSSESFDPNLGQLVQDVLSRHPALQRVAREREGAEAALRANRLGWLPDPVLTGSFRTELDGEVRTFGVGFKVPLWNQSRAAADRERLRLEALEHREEALKLEVEAQLLIHQNHLRLSRQTLRLFEEGLLTEAEASMAIAETSYRQGEISFVEYLDSRRTYHSIQIDYQQALFDWNRERAEFDRAAGGDTL